MRFIGCLSLALLAGGCVVSDVDPTGSKSSRPPSAAGDASDTKEVDSDSVADEIAPVEPDEAEDEGCRKLISLDLPARPDDSASSLPETPLEFDLQYEKGIAVVSLQGPQILLDPITRCRSTLFGGYGYLADWDDEPPFFRDPDCSTDLRHEFHVGGTFEIRANTFHPGPNDGPIFDSRHTARVEIDSAKLESRELPLSLSIAGDERTFKLFEGPNLEYTVHKNRPVYLCVELRGETGVIDTSELVRIRNHIDGELYPYQYFKYGEAYQAALRAGESQFHARAFVFDESKKLLDRAISEPFRLTQLEADDRRMVTLSTDGLKVTLELESYSPSCLQLDIDWGDGTEHTQRRPETLPNGCVDERGVFRFEHRYAAPGTYEVILHASDFDPEIPLEEVVGYSRYTVKAGAY